LFKLQGDRTPKSAKNSAIFCDNLEEIETKAQQIRREKKKEYLANAIDKVPKEEPRRTDEELLPSWSTS